jgi:hypothetical protein
MKSWIFASPTLSGHFTGRSINIEPAAEQTIPQAGPDIDECGTLHRLLNDNLTDATNGACVITVALFERQARILACHTVHSESQASPSPLQWAPPNHRHANWGIGWAAALCR